ncbi:hypothetical protein KY289_024604 [Solanum tuberosum]|nr:hypothetical protein KY289_024604 [Solanum tuberosum]
MQGRRPPGKSSCIPFILIDAPLSEHYSGTRSSVLQFSFTVQLYGLTSPRNEDGEAAGACIGVLALRNRQNELDMQFLFQKQQPLNLLQQPIHQLAQNAFLCLHILPVDLPQFLLLGPYAHETQLVSPPVFSAFTTEPSTAPFTPPPESVHLTTPSSPEVPFAKLLDPNYQNVAAGHRYPFAQYEFQSYQLQPGSPVSNLISPGSAISVSGTSSPFLDREYTPGRPQFLNLEKIAPHEWGSRQGSGTLTPEAVNPKYHDNFLLNYQNSGVHRLPSPLMVGKNDLTVVDHRVSFEITAEDVVRCVEKKPTMMMRTGSVSLQDTERSTKRQENLAEMSNGHDHGGHEPSREIHEGSSTDGEDGQRQQKHRSITLGSSKEFNFDNVDGGYPDKATIGSDWWANEKVLGKEPCNNWIFPMMQPGVS